jgi:hypothetical protein
VILEWIPASAGKSVLEIESLKCFHTVSDYGGLNGSASGSHPALSLLRPPQSGMRDVDFQTEREHVSAFQHLRLVTACQINLPELLP